MAERRTIASRMLQWAQGLLPLAALLLAWQFVGRTDSPYFPPPAAWWDTVVRLATSGRLLPRLGATLEVFGVALALSCVLGTALGLAIGLHRGLARLLSPLLELLRCLPPPVAVPIAVLLLGYGKELKIAVVVAAAVWPILITTAGTVAATHPLLADAARTLHLGRLRTLRDVVFPAALPSILLGIKIAIPIALVVTLLVEMVTLLPGIGSLIVQAQREFRSAEVYGLLVLVGLLGFGLNHAFARLERAVMKHWPPPAA